MRCARLASPGARTNILSYFSFDRLGRLRRKWPRRPFMRMIFPVLVTFSRFAAALWVLSFGMVLARAPSFTARRKRLEAVQTRAAIGRMSAGGNLGDYSRWPESAQTKGSRSRGPGQVPVGPAERSGCSAVKVIRDGR